MKPNTKAWRKARRRRLRRRLRLCREAPNPWFFKLPGTRLASVDVVCEHPETGQPLLRYRFSNGFELREWSYGWHSGQGAGTILKQP